MGTLWAHIGAIGCIGLSLTMSTLTHDSSTVLAKSPALRAQLTNNKQVTLPTLV